VGPKKRQHLGTRYKTPIIVALCGLQTNLRLQGSLFLTAVYSWTYRVGILHFTSFLFGIFKETGIDAISYLSKKASGVKKVFFFGEGSFFPAHRKNARNYCFSPLRISSKQNVATSGETSGECRRHFRGNRLLRINQTPGPHHGLGLTSVATVAWASPGQKDEVRI